MASPHGNITNTVVNILPFECENLYSHYPDEMKLIKYYNSGYQSVIKLIEDTNFDINKPQFHNVFITNLRSNEAHVFEDGAWTTQNQDETVERLFSDKSLFLTENFKEAANRLNSSVVNKFSKFKDETDPDTLKRLKHDIKMMLYDKRKIPQATRIAYEKSLKNK